MSVGAAQRRSEPPGELSSGQYPLGWVRAAPAFTLLEILITLGLLVLLAGIAWPALEKQIKSSHMPESAERVRSALFMARCEAVMEHRRYRVRFAPHEQQPVIEHEPDPIRQPGVFETAPVDWAEEPVLLADVQVHEIRPGRPVYLQPLSTTDDPKSMQKAADEALERKRERENPVFGLQAGPDKKTETDEHRPVITFETDGSTEWATLILARVSPDDQLNEEEEQFWIVLDGRTGLAFVRGKVTQEQLADSEFYVQREKLEPSDLVNVDNLSFDVPLGAGGANLGSQAGLDLGAGAESASPEQGDAAGAKDLASEVAGAVKDQGGKAEDSGQQNGAQDVQSQLDTALKKSDLNDQEKENVRQGFSSRKSK